MPQSTHTNSIKTVQMANAILLPEVVRLLNDGHTVTLPLRGYSMRPFLEDGRDKAEIFPKHYVLHRIVAIDGDHVTLRGDGNLATESCRLADIKATAIGFYRKGRQTLDSVDSKKWRTYSRLWTFLFPIRRYLLAFHRRIWLKLFKPI